MNGLLLGKTCKAPPRQKYLCREDKKGFIQIIAVRGGRHNQPFNQKKEKNKGAVGPLQTTTTTTTKQKDDGGFLSTMQSLLCFHFVFSLFSPFFSLVFQYSLFSLSPFVCTSPPLPPKGFWVFTLPSGRGTARPSPSSRGPCTARAAPRWVPCSRCLSAAPAPAPPDCMYIVVCFVVLVCDGSMDASRSVLTKQTNPKHQRSTNTPHHHPPIHWNPQPPHGTHLSR